MLPVGPRHVFVAVNTAEMEDVLRLRSPADFARALNDQTVRSAHTYVYGSDDGQLRFVDNRLGRGKP